MRSIGGEGFDMLAIIRGAGDLASGIALRLQRAECDVIMLDMALPTAVRRTVSFCEAIRLGETHVEDVCGRLCICVEEARTIAAQGIVAVLVDPEGESIARLAPDVVVDAIIAKRNLGTSKEMAPIVIGVGPGFLAGEGPDADCHAAVETKRGHHLGRVIYDGSPIPNSGVPGDIGGYTVERVLRAPVDGTLKPVAHIGDVVRRGDVIASVAGAPLPATIGGVLRGLLQEGVPVTCGMKVGDIDPRCRPDHCHSCSDKARAIGGGVLEALLHFSGRLRG